MAQKITKTNALRILDSEKICYRTRTYEVDESDLSGEHVAKQLGLDADSVFKTLVLKGDKTGYIVACIPVKATIDLKALAKLSQNKSVQMIPVKELFGLTGYIRGGCSPVGMKKKLPTFFDDTIECFEEITVSAGMRGLQMVVSCRDLIRITAALVGPITVF